MTETITVEPTIITRVLNAPMALVFKAWTDAEHLKHWNFPFPGVTCEYKTTDIKAGGSTLHKMVMPNGHEMWLLTKYEEIRPHDLVVFRQYMSDESGAIFPNPQMPDWPKEMRTTINLTEVDGKTNLELVWAPVNPTQAEADAFEMSRPNHQKGWGGGLDQLKVYVEK